MKSGSQGRARLTVVAHSGHDRVRPITSAANVAAIRTPWRCSGESSLSRVPLPNMCILQIDRDNARYACIDYTRFPHAATFDSCLKPRNFVSKQILPLTQNPSRGYLWIDLVDRS